MTAEARIYELVTLLRDAEDARDEHRALLEEARAEIKRLEDEKRERLAVAA